MALLPGTMGFKFTASSCIVRDMEILGNDNPARCTQKNMQHLEIPVARNKFFVQHRDTYF